MAKRPENKMPVSERAKQFMPFSTLRGLSEALAAKEKILVPKIDLSPEMAEELDWKMHQIERGKMASVTYFHDGEYIKVSGMVARIDKTSRILQIVNTRISFDDILDVDCGC